MLKKLYYMGYKSTLRSISAASNRAAREAERRRRQEEKEQKRLQKKVAGINEKMDKILLALDGIYASGKIDKNSYQKLKLRQSDIGLDLIALAKTPGVTLAKRYITGKIDKDEFESMQKDLLPAELFEEKENIKKATGAITKELEKFRKDCKEAIVDTCQHCGTKKAFLRPIKTEDGLQLCGGCRSKLLKIQKYKGFSGKYLTVAPIRVKFTDADAEKFTLEAVFNNNLL